MSEQWLFDNVHPTGPTEGDLWIKAQRWSRQLTVEIYQDTLPRVRQVLDKAWRKHVDALYVDLGGEG